MIDPKIKTKQRITIAILIVLLIAAVIWSMTSGEYKLSFQQILHTILGQGEYTENLILLDFRMPRMLITLLVGAALAMSGAIIQSITRNPLAEPGILGINAGSGFAIALFITIGHIDPSTFVYVLPLVSLIGGVVTSLIIFGLSYNQGKGITPSSMVLIGVGLATGLTGASLTLMAKFDEDQAEFIATWFAGNIWGDEWAFVIAFLPWVLIIVPFLFAKSNVLNLLNTHEFVAQGVGVRVSIERFVLLITAVVLSSAAVSVAGSIGFIGLMGPHIAKSIVGPRHQLFLPICILVGACLLVFADTVGKVILQPSGVPAGIVVAVIGAPYFLYLMYKTRSV